MDMRQTDQARFLSYNPFCPMAHFSHSPTSLDFPTMHTPRLSHPAHGTAKKPSTGDRKQKFDSNCNFFAIGNCCEPSDRGPRYKTAGNPPLSGRFRFVRLKNEPLIAKKLQKERDFCFHNRQIATTRTRPYEKRVKSPSKGKKGIPPPKKKSKKAKPHDPPQQRWRGKSHEGGLQNKGGSARQKKRGGAIQI